MTARDHHIESHRAPSTQIHDLIGIPPGWLLRSGITVVALVTGVVLLLAAFIKYPDKIITQGIMTSAHPPIQHLNPVSGIIEEIFVQNGALVSENDPLIYIKNPTNRGDLQQIIAFIQAYQANEHLLDLMELNLPAGLLLGEMQDAYGRLQLEFSQFQQTLRLSGVAQQINSLQQELQKTRELRKVLIADKDYLKKEMDLIERGYRRNLRLNQEGVISDADKEKGEAEWLRYQKNYSKLDQGIIQNKIREEQLILQMQRLTEDRATAIQNHTYNINQSINALLSGKEQWEERYYIHAQVEGEVAFVPDIVEDKYLNPNTVVLSIIPTDNNNNKQIQVRTNSHRLGKINIDDKVIIKVDGYPYKEFGTLTSRVQSIAELPEVISNTGGENQYLYTIRIALPDTLLTNHNRVIPYRPHASLTAEIITEDKSALNRLFSTFISLIKQE